MGLSSYLYGLSSYSLTLQRLNTKTCKIISQHCTETYMRALQYLIFAVDAQGKVKLVNNASVFKGYLNLEFVSKVYNRIKQRKLIICDDSNSVSKAPPF